MISAKQKYVTTAAGLAAGFAWAGTAAAAPVLTSKVAAGFTPVSYTSKTTDTSGTQLGSFDTSGAGLNTVNITSNAASSTPKLFLSSNGQVAATNDPFGNYVSAFSSAPTSLSSFSTGAYIDKGSTSNFSMTPMFGFTTYAANGGTAVGYFAGTFSSTSTTATFTLTDYGTATGIAIAAVPEPETWAMLALGFAGMGAALRGRRKGAAPATIAA